MYRRRRLAAAGLGLVLIGALVLGVQGVRALVSGLTARSAVDTVTVPVTATTPVRLDLGSGGLDLPIYGAGLDEDGEIDQIAGAYGAFSPFSWWPLWLALSASLIFLGVAVAMWIAAFGAILGVWALCGWVFEYYSGEHAH